MLVKVSAFHRNGNTPTVVEAEIDLDEFDRSMDAEGVAEYLEIVLCDDYGVIDIDEEDLLVEAERIYQELNVK